ncbi:MAG: NAD-dependent epimerase/dehydratase family protein [Armatimonadia bacterium]|nr:NAD-dependent epimerase/dehydratase family protein [Armatimonadia bacterium]
MGRILVTGASGFIGGGVIRDLELDHGVVAMSRHDPDHEGPWVQGEFQSFEDLRALDQYEIDAVVHLGAVTGGCSERDGMAVNVEGTRALMRYLVDGGCRKFVLASSIAAVGLADAAFRPEEMPIADDHPCLATDAYGLSKYLMEEVARYFVRQNRDLDVIALRLAAIFADEDPPPLRSPGAPSPYALATITSMALSDTVRAIRLAVEAPHKEGLRVLNTTHPEAWTAVPVAEVLRAWWGSSVDVSHYDEPGRQYDSPFGVARIDSELGFVAKHGPDRYRE